MSKEDTRHASDQARIELTRRIVREMREAMVAKVITEIKALPRECRQSGDDSVLADGWEEFKYLIQRGDLDACPMYEETIRATCLGPPLALDRTQQELLWIWGSGYCQWRGDEGEIPYGEPLDEALEDELFKAVCEVAGSEELAVDPDEDMQRERFQDDIRINQAEGEG